MNKTMKKLRNHVRVLAQGTFDLLHVGHVHYLSFARSKGDELIVIIARDRTVERVKHHAPMQDEHTRREMVSALKVVDEAVLGGNGDMLDKVVEIHPDVIVLGYDQRVSIPELKKKLVERGLQCKVVRARAHLPSKHKSSRWKAVAAKHYQITST